MNVYMGGLMDGLKVCMYVGICVLMVYECIYVCMYVWCVC